MADNKICPNCNKINKIDSIICENCGSQLDQNSVISNVNDNIQNNNSNNLYNQSNNNDNLKGNILGIVSLILFFGDYVLELLSIKIPVIQVVQNLFPLCGIVTLIVGRVNYPSNKLLKITMWMVIITIILGLISVILIAIFFYAMCNGVDTSGCS